MEIKLSVDKKDFGFLLSIFNSCCLFGVIFLFFGFMVSSWLLLGFSIVCFGLGVFFPLFLMFKGRKRRPMPVPPPPPELIKENIENLREEVKQRIEQSKPMPNKKRGRPPKLKNEKDIPQFVPLQKPEPYNDVESIEEELDD